MLRTVWHRHDPVSTYTNRSHHSVIIYSCTIIAGMTMANGDGLLNSSLRYRPVAALLALCLPCLQGIDVGTVANGSWRPGRTRRLRGYVQVAKPLTGWTKKIAAPI